MAGGGIWFPDDGETVGKHRLFVEKGCNVARCSGVAAAKTLLALPNLLSTSFTKRRTEADSIRCIRFSVCCDSERQKGQSVCCDREFNKSSVVDYVLLDRKKT